jgi:GcrA cell cycle regulator
MKGIWTRARIALIERLWSEGKTSTAIAAHLDGISRAAVLGKIFRLRLGARKAAKNESAKTGVGRSRKSKALGRRHPGRPRVERPVAPAVIVPPLPPPPPLSLKGKQRGKSLLELDNGSCRWPFGRPGTKAFHFCGVAGADVENGRPYCEPHMRRAYPAPPPNPGKQKRSPATNQKPTLQPVATTPETRRPSERLRRYERGSRR